MLDAPAAPTRRAVDTRWWVRVARPKYALMLWAVLVAAMIARWGLPTKRDNLILVITLGLVAATAGNPRAWARVVRDWVPLFVLLEIYDKLRAHADGWSHVHVTPQIEADKWMFGGSVPTLRLQHLLFTPGHPHWWDYAAFLVYLSHFFVPLVVAGLLWKFAHPRFLRFAFLFVALTFAAFVTYAVYPAAPPWLASRTPHALGPTWKVIDQMWVTIGLRSTATVLSSNSHLANPVAAIPSLHSAYPFLLLLFFWRSAGRFRWLLPLYPLAMGFALVYGAEHYVIDVLLGWFYAAAIFVLGNLVADRWSRFRSRRAAIAELERLGGLSGGTALDVDLLRHL